MKKIVSKMLFVIILMFLFLYSNVNATSLTGTNSKIRGYNTINYGSTYDKNDYDSAESLAKQRYNSNSEYVIESYDVEINVSEDNIYDITETITTDFRTSKHGIYRSIPIQNSVRRADGSTSSNKATITNIKVNDSYSTSRGSNMLKIKIGSADRTLTGEHTYVISYKYNIGNDKLDNADEFYLNLVGTEWDTQIKQVSFKINMPKEFDKSKMGFSTGKYGTAGTYGIDYSVDGTTITGYYNHYLNANEGLNARIELPEGYYKKQTLKIGFSDILLFGVAIAGIVITYMKWDKYGRDEKAVPTVEFYPPDGLNSLDLAYAYRGTATSKDAVSLLIYLANKGYVKIEEEEGKGLFKSKTFKIYKIRDYDGSNEEERRFMVGLFSTASTSESGLKYVDKSDLTDSFYTTINSVVSMAGKQKNVIFKKTSLSSSFAGILMLVLTYIAMIIRVVAFSGMQEGLFTISFVGIAFLAAGGLFISQPGKNVAVTLASLLFVGIGFFLPMIGKLSDMLEGAPGMLLLEILFSVIAMIVILIILKYMPSRTPKGVKLLGKIEGFKNFLETAEKDRLEELVNENPSYFYNILPYAYVLGVSDKWIKNFESIAMEPPTWYVGYEPYSLYTMSHFMNTTMASVNSAMVSSPSSSNGGSGFSSGGGGFSGGGSGGGGGGSW